MYSTASGEIPSVGKVDLAWIQTPLPPVNLSLKSHVTRNGADEDTHMDEGDAIVTSSPAHGGGGGSGHEPQENIDYDVADDNDWGVD
jgi:hypothetical protein